MSNPPSNNKISVDPSKRQPPEYGSNDGPKVTVDASKKRPPEYGSREGRKVTVDPSKKGPPDYETLEKIIVNPNIKNSNQSLNDGDAPPKYEVFGFDPNNRQQTQVCLLPDLVVRQPEHLIMKGEFWSSSATITNANSIDVLRVEAETFSLSHRKAIYNVSGKLLFTVRKDTFTFGPPSYYFEAPDGSGQRIFELKNKWTLGASKAEAAFTNPLTQRNTILEMKGEFFGTRSEITEMGSGRSVAQIDKRRFAMKATYELTIDTGVDLALIVGMCVCLEDRARSKRSHSAGGGGGA